MDINPATIILGFAPPSSDIDPAQGCGSVPGQAF
jgi:hypothetical protein